MENNNEYYDIEYYDNYQIDSTGNIYSKGERLKLQTNKDGYLLCYLYKDSIRHTLLHHRLVASLFHDNYENKEYVNHIDGNKSNNNPINLEWCTPKENSNHSINVLGNKQKGGDKSKLSFEIAESIRFRHNNGESISSLSREYNVSRSSIFKILNNKSYSKKYI